MLNLSFSDSGLYFSSFKNGQRLPFADWSQTDDCIYYFPLATLVDNGMAQVDENGCLVPFENLYALDQEDRDLLGVPSLYDKALRLRGEGMLNTTDFRYKLEHLTHVPDGDLIPGERKGNIFITAYQKYLFPELQYELIRQVEAFNQEEPELKTPEHNFRSFASIKDLALRAHCELDSYLDNENVVAPEKIKIEIGNDGEGFTLDPAVDIAENDKFQHNFDRMRRIQSVYPVQRENGERVRVVLNPAQKEDLNFIKTTGGRRRTREEIKELVDHPTEYFNPENFDLSELYSDRVIEIGIYKPKFYPFVSPYKSCWIAGATIETPDNGTAHLRIETEEDLQLLQQAIERAESEKKEIVNYRNCSMATEDARFLAETAEKQLASPKRPIETDETETKVERKVLIIEDNAESLNFSEDKQVAESSHYTLYPNPGLHPDFSLKSHQQEGVAWLQYLYLNHASGCLMADDMGLGKTLQILYFMDWHARQHPDHKPYLVVAPVSLLENWENEYNRFFTGTKLQVCRLTSREVPRKFDKGIVHEMQGMDLILTNYESLKNAQLNFCAVDFDIVALDEAQKIKSPGTMVTNAAKALKAHFKIAMTGTPVENTLLDLWCIMDFCVPGLLGNAKDFAAQYQHPLKDEDTDLVALGNEIHEKLGVYFMRRLKKDAAKDLPNKTERKEPVLMPEVQEKAYEEVVHEYVDGVQPSMLVTILGIKEVSEHPFLHDDTLADHTSADLILHSARLKATVNFLDEIKEKDEKVILFVERKEIQRMLQKVCLDRYGVVAKIINGDTPSIVKRSGNGRQSRQSAIDEFQRKRGFNVIIMSPIAAGMGLNVTAANHVIHYSRHWNPAKESQATDRAYRIGQTKDVYVYYPMAVSPDFKSFDETLDDLLNRKTSLATSTIFPTERVEVKQDELGQMLFGK